MGFEDGVEQSFGRPCRQCDDRSKRTCDGLFEALAGWLRQTTGAKNLCMAGGVALNCVANGRIVREAGFENVWIQPAAGDDGIAIGCAYYVLNVKLVAGVGYGKSGH
jgi:carbamoyltransferase